MITPDQDLDSDVEWDREEHIGPASMDLRHFEQALARTVRYWRAKVKHQPSGRDYNDILAVLRPDFDRVPKLSLLSRAMEEDYIALASQQYEMLRGAESNQRILVTGGAGSGKTLLAVETARRAASMGAEVLLTCRSPRVIELMRKQIGDSGIDCRPFANVIDLEPADVLVVDEAQDLMNVDDMLILEQAVKGGLADGRWRLFCDPNNQAHVHGAYEVDVFDEIRASANLYELPYNCRNPGPVVTQAQLVTGADVGIPRLGHGPEVRYARFATVDDEAALLDGELKRMRQHEVDAADIVVVTLLDEAGESGATRSKAFRTGRLKVTRQLDGHAVPLVTAAEFKGLEAAHVLVVDVDDLNYAGRRSRLYVAMTRPRISLWLAVSDNAWRQMAEREI